MHYLCSFLIASLLYGCSKEEDYQPESSFIKIFDDGSFESDYDPIDMVQAGENGFFILSAYDSWNTYILRVDEEGNFMWDFKLDDSYVNPIKGLYFQDSAFYFFCMDDVTLGTYLMKATDAGKNAVVDKSFGNILYPLHSSQVSDGFLLESYNRESYSTRLTKLDVGFDTRWSEEYKVEQDVEEPIISHLTRIGERLPFFTGQAGDKYFLNGYFNYSMSMIFVNGNDGSQTGVVNGFREKSAISAAQYLNGNSFALSRFSFDDNFIMAKIDINTSSIAISSDLAGGKHPEMTQNARVYIKSLDVNGRNISLYATSTKAGQILLYAFDALNGKLIGTHHIGRINPYEAVGFVQTADGGLLVLATTYVNGRFPRIALIKLSEKELIGFAS